MDTAVDRTANEHVLDSRRRAPEEAFFAKHNEALRLRLGRNQADATQRAAMADATGITDVAVPDALSGLGLGVDTIAAVTPAEEAVLQDLQRALG